MRGFDQSAPSYYVRLGSLSSRLRSRAYSRTLAKLQEAKQRSKGFIEELNVTADLVGLHGPPPSPSTPLVANAQRGFSPLSQVEYSKRNLDSANQMVGDTLSSLVAWRSSAQSAEVRENLGGSRGRGLTLKRNAPGFTCCLVVSYDTLIPASLNFCVRAPPPES